MGRLVITGDWLFHPPIHPKMGGLVITSPNDANDKKVGTPVAETNNNLKKRRKIWCGVILVGNFFGSNRMKNIYDSITDLMRQNIAFSELEV